MAFLKPFGPVVCYEFMKQYNIVIGDKEYLVDRSLHKGFFTVTSNNLSVLITKDDKGRWELSLPSTQAIDFPIVEIGKAIDLVDSEVPKI